MPLLLTVVTAVLLTACAGAESGPASGGATPPARPTPTVTSSPTPSSPRPSSPTASPTPSTSAEITEAVTQWYEYGGGTAMVSLIEEAEKAQSGRPGEEEEFALVILDFSGLDEALGTARLFGSIPDPKTQKTWSAAIERLDEGAREVLASAPEGRTFQSPTEAGQAFRGWNTFDEGLKNLKKTVARLDRTFGLKPPSDPWEKG
ncbi:hypothetical protein [Streptomyces sp. 404i]|uniref:hypothetical protein n=1 Tax=Streptomyces sp. 404i TaxID=2824902 RepID=UPI001B37B614|nr:hypothetical protein [Streptomyces sp. 404i]MBQ1104985.1 hypothetical protein [Streptomyces sp. 404i]